MKGGARVSEDREIRVLLIDQDHAFGPLLNNVLGDGYCLKHACMDDGVVDLIERDAVDVVLLNWDDPDPVKHLRELLPAARGLPIPAPVVAFSWDRAGALDALREGAFDFFLLSIYNGELRRKRYGVHPNLL